MRILIIEDDYEMREVLRLTLERELFVVDYASDGKQGSLMARTNDYDLILLDNILPQKPGLEVCRDIRNAGKTLPILVLSAKSDASDKTAMLDAGVDDYVTKPYSHNELIARIRALTRRPKFIQPTRMETGNLSMNVSTCEVKIGGKEIYLTTKEFSLLELLLRNKGKVVTRGAILEHVWDVEGDPISKTVETHILNLRKKIETRDRKIIINVSGRGYKIEA